MIPYFKASWLATMIVSATQFHSIMPPSLLVPRLELTSLVSGTLLSALAPHSALLRLY